MNTIITEFQFCKRDTHNEKWKKYGIFFEEFLIRQMFWMFHSWNKIEEYLNKIKDEDLINEYKNNYKSEIDLLSLLNFIFLKTHRRPWIFYSIKWGYKKKQKKKNYLELADKKFMIKSLI